MTEIRCVVLVVVLTFLQSLARGDAEVSCVFMESCILPCSFRGGIDVVIHWIQVTTGDTPVHSYYHNQDQLAHQNQRFSGRTSLFKNQISRGNASLQLTGVQIQDRGRYKCYTSIIGRNPEESYINLKVDDAAPVYPPSPSPTVLPSLTQLPVEGEEGNSPSVGGIIGRVVGAILIVGAVAGLVLFCQGNSQSQPNSDGAQQGTELEEHADGNGPIPRGNWENPANQPLLQEEEAAQQQQVEGEEDEQQQQQQVEGEEDKQQQQQVEGEEDEQQQQVEGEEDEQQQQQVEGEEDEQQQQVEGEEDEQQQQVEEQELEQEDSNGQEVKQKEAETNEPRRTEGLNYAQMH